MNRLSVTVGLGEDSDGVADPPSTVVIAVQVHGTIGHRFDYSVRVGCPQNRLRLRFAQRSMSALPSNNRFERSRGRIFVGPRRESMMGINQLRLMSAPPRVAQPHR
jgi:hypothetical protein